MPYAKTLPNSEATPAVGDPSEGAVRKCFSHVVPWCVLFYVLSYVDRINIGFAALAMNKDLGLTATKFGFSNTALFIMFCVSAVPSNIMLARLGPRRWIPWLTTAWGITSIMTIFAIGPYSLYALRAFVGLAEGGLMSGMLYYLGFWFPKEHRARANSLYLASLPIALTISGPLSGAVLELNGWLGLEGWRWLFILEGLPSILVGIVALFRLPNTPSEVAWLTTEEKSALISRLQREHTGMEQQERHSGRRSGILNPVIIVLALAYFCMMATANSLAVWAPQIVNELVGKGSRPLIIGILVALPSLVSIFIMQAVSHHSDRTGERARHLVLSMTAIAAGWMVVLVEAPAIKLFGLAVSSSGTYSAMALFWATAVQFIPRRSQAVGIGFVSTVATVATFVTPLIIGVLRDRTHNFYSGIWYLTVLTFLGIVMLAAVPNFAAKYAPLGGLSKHPM